jgi:hypothetical protein
LGGLLLHLSFICLNFLNFYTSKEFAWYWLTTTNNINLILHYSFDSLPTAKKLHYKHVFTSTITTSVELNYMAKSNNINRHTFINGIIYLITETVPWCWILLTIASCYIKFIMHYIVWPAKSEFKNNNHKKSISKLLLKMYNWKFQSRTILNWLAIMLFCKVINYSVWQSKRNYELRVQNIKKWLFTFAFTSMSNASRLMRYRNVDMDKCESLFHAHFLIH